MPGFLAQIPLSVWILHDVRLMQGKPYTRGDSVAGQEKSFQAKGVSSPSGVHLQMRILAEVFKLQ
jgi:hypothetical protein